MIAMVSGIRAASCCASIFAVCDKWFFSAWKIALYPAGTTARDNARLAYDTAAESYAITSEAARAE